MPPAAPPRLAYAAWAAICLVWGTSYLAIKIALESLPPLVITGARYAIAGALLLGWMMARRDTLPPRAAWPGLVGAGVLMLALGNGLLVAAELYVPSGLTAVLVATTPLWMVAVEAARRDGERFAPQQWAGLLLGLGGIVLLAWPDIFTDRGIGWGFAAGVLALQVACLGWAVGTAMGKRQAIAVSPLHASAVQMFGAGVGVLALATLGGDWHGLQVTSRSALALAYLALVASLFGFLCYTYALVHLPTSFVGLYAYVNPLVAIALGALVAGERVTPRIAAAVAVILGSTFVVTRAAPPPPVDRPAAATAGAGARSPS